MDDKRLNAPFPVSPSGIAGIQVFPGFAVAMLRNYGTYTLTFVAYSDDKPVIIKEKTS